MIAAFQSGRCGKAVVTVMTAVMLFALPSRWGADCGAQDAVADPAAEVTAIWDLVPAEASVVIGIRNVARLTERGDQLATRTEQGDRFNFVQGYEWIRNLLKLQRGVDPQGSAVVMGLGPIDLQGMALAVPIDDLEAILSNYSLGPDDVADGKIADFSEWARRNDLLMARCCMVLHGHLILADSPAILRALRDGPRLSETLSPELRQAMADDDIVAHFLPDEIDVQFRNGMTRWIDERVATAENESNFTREEIAALRDVSAALQELKQITCGIDLAHGIGSSLFLGFAGERSQEVLSKYSATLESVAPQLVVDPATQARRISRFEIASGDAGSGALSQSLLQVLLREWTAMFPNYLPVDQGTNLAGMFGHLSQRIVASRSDLYLNQDPLHHGSHCLVIKLRTDDPDTFVEQLNELAHFIEVGALTETEFRELVDPVTIEALIARLADDRYEVRQTATTKLRLIGRRIVPELTQAAASDDLEISYRAALILRQLTESAAADRNSAVEGNPWARLRPKFAFFPAAETRGNRKIDIVRMQLEGDDTTAAERLESLFGSDWNRFRVVTDRETVLLFVGSNETLLDRVLAEDPDLAALTETPPHTVLTESRQHFLNRSAARRTAELELSLADFAAMRNGREPSAVATTETTSIGLSLRLDSLRIDLFVPYGEVKAGWDVNTGGN